MASTAITARRIIDFLPDRFFCAAGLNGSGRARRFQVKRFIYLAGFFVRGSFEEWVANADRIGRGFVRGKKSGIPQKNLADFFLALADARSVSMKRFIDSRIFSA
ncbi:MULTISPECIES: hypothetical protein [unclassified Bradyrhizobium]|uniref:hypothetical protein n=1 Tax=unclassified Bradyrhizobium TaxID=2631580 RepID=UPI00351598C3